MADPGTLEFDCDSLEEYEIASALTLKLDEAKAEIERLRAGNDERDTRIAKLVEDNQCIPLLEAEIERLRAALCWGIGGCLNDMQVRGLPLEWSPGGGVGKMLAALGVNADRMTPEVWDVVQGKILRKDGQPQDR